MTACGFGELIELFLPKAGKVIEAKDRAALFSSKPFGEGTAFESLAIQRRTLLTSSPDFYSENTQIVPISGLTEYVVDRSVVDERRS